MHQNLSKQFMKPAQKSAASQFRFLASFPIWLVGFLVLSALAANSEAQSCAQIGGTCQMVQLFSFTRTIGGQTTTFSQTNDVGTVEITQNGQTFTISTNVFTGSMTGTITNNSVVSLQGPAVIYPIAPTSVSTNSIISVTNWLSETQLVIAYQGRAKGMNNSFSFQDTINSYIYLTGKFTPLRRPAITVQPQNQTNVAGSQVVFYVEATNATPFSYQWRKDGALIPSATNSSYVINSVASANAGNYTVQVSNSMGSTNSAKAALVLRYAPSITVQPVASLKQQLGTRATLKVKAAGTPDLFYQWRLNGEDISGATNSTCPVTFEPVGGNTSFKINVLVTNAFGSQLSSDATLTIIPDTARPTVTILSPAANARTANPIFSGVATDNGGVAEVNYWVTNISNGIITNNDQGTATLVGSNPSRLLWQASPRLLPGTNILVLQSRDKSGNLSESRSARFFTESQPISF